MRFAALALAVMLAASACQTIDGPSASTDIRYLRGDGRTAETAVVIGGARSSMDGVPAEYAWIRQNLPGARIESQSLVTGSKVYDVFDVTLPSGETREVFFDITAFFGRGR
jgi:hypothetical protein